MGETTGISWTDHTWSPWYGCTQVSLGEHGACVGCYARQISETRQKRVVFGGPGRGEGTRDFRPDSAWKEPLRWEREAAVMARGWAVAHPDGQPWPFSPFVFPSMCDPFDNHPALRDERRRFFDLIHATPHLTWLLLTKRPQNIVKLWRDAVGFDIRDGRPADKPWPSNAAIGCTVVTQTEADRDVSHLLAAKAALKPAFAFLSMEPLLGPVDLTRLKRFADLPAEFIDALRGTVWTDQSGVPNPDPSWAHPGRPSLTHGVPTGGIDWVITGGETDQGTHRARPSHPDWFRSLRDQCAAAGIAYQHKQNGEWIHRPEMIDARGPDTHRFPDGAWMDKVGKKAAGRLLDGVEHNARPVVA